MQKSFKKYRRCKSCKELIMARLDDCPNCEKRNKLTGFIPVYHGRKASLTLDNQEGNFND